MCELIFLAKYLISWLDFDKNTVTKYYSFDATRNKELYLIEKLSQSWLHDQ
jgi:hypothetical protein